MDGTLVRAAIMLDGHHDCGRTARRFVIVTLRHWQAIELIFRASEVATELIGPVAVGAHDEIELVLIRVSRGVRVEVYDGSASEPSSTAVVHGCGRPTC